MSVEELKLINNKLLIFLMIFQLIEILTII